MRDLYLTTHNTQKRQTSMPPAGFKPTISASKRSQTHALDCVATGIGVGEITTPNFRTLPKVTPAFLKQQEFMVVPLITGN
jgi:hypothetical protein